MLRLPCISLRKPQVFMSSADAGVAMSKAALKSSRSVWIYIILLSAPVLCASTAFARRLPAAAGLEPSEFAAVSLKPNPPGTSVKGFACHGSNGTSRSFLGSPNSFTAPQGRCVGSVLLSQLIQFTYDILPSWLSGGPDWVSRNGPGLQTFEVEGVAEDPSGTTLEQLREMLKTVLVDRFKLQFHREQREGPGYALVLGKKGSKLNRTSGDQESPFPILNSKDQPVLKGKSSLNQFARLLSRFVNAPVVNLTGLSEIYEYEFLLPFAGRGGGGQRGAGRGQRGAGTDDVDISDALEAQLGLRLERNNKVQWEIIVIDRVELPSAN
jgi:uncharacterized protein (TIGR03435 family)